jgi:integrase
MRAGEAWNLKWIDIDFVNTTVRIAPEKRSSPRMFKVSTKLLAMLSMLPKRSDLVFGYYEMRGF